MLPLSALSALLAATLSLELVAAHGADPAAQARHHKRQNNVAAASTGIPATSTGVAATSKLATSTGATTGSAAPTQGAPAGTGPYNVPPLASITSGMPPGPTPTLATTYTPGATPGYSGAPPLPSKFVFNSADWPPLDKTPPTDSDEVKEWMKELEGHDIPEIPPSTGECTGVSDEQAEKIHWWTCGHHTVDTDIVVCPDKLTWGVSFDDGPSPYSPTVINYLHDKNLTATFFVVGSRVISYPDILIAEYMAGNEIAAHSWAHPKHTTLTNEQLVAEFGWTRKAIKAVLGVTPTTWRPPYGDIDDRVRAIGHAMGMTPIIWTTGPGGPFDTNDWQVPAGVYTGPQQFGLFQGILGNASLLDTGFIVLEHDLFPETVDLAVGYTLDAALSHQPSLELEAIGECSGIAPNNLYKETATKDISNTNSSSGSNSSSSSSNSSAASGSNDAVALPLPCAALAGAVVAVAAACVAGSF